MRNHVWTRHVWLGSLALNSGLEKEKAIDWQSMLKVKSCFDDLRMHSENILFHVLYANFAVAIAILTVKTFYFTSNARLWLWQKWENGDRSWIGNQLLFVITNVNVCKMYIHLLEFVLLQFIVWKLPLCILTIWPRGLFCFWIELQSKLFFLK